jgi:hypothetical protein
VLGDLVGLLSSARASSLPLHLFLLSSSTQELMLRRLPPAATARLRLEHAALPALPALARSLARVLCLRGDLPLVLPAAICDLLAEHGEGYAAHPGALPRGLLAVLGLHFFAPPPQLCARGSAVLAAEARETLAGGGKRTGRAMTGWFTQKGSSSEALEGGAKGGAAAAAASGRALPGGAPPPAANSAAAAAAAAAAGGGAASAAPAQPITWDIVSDRDRPLPRTPWLRSEAAEGSSGGGPLNPARLSLLCAPLERWAVGLVLATGGGGGAQGRAPCGLRLRARAQG